MEYNTIVEVIPQESSNNHGFGLEHKRNSQTADTLKIKLKVKKATKTNFSNLPIQVNLNKHYPAKSDKNTFYLPNDQKFDLHHILNPPRHQKQLHDSYENKQPSPPPAPVPVPALQMSKK